VFVSLQRHWIKETIYLGHTLWSPCYVNTGIWFVSHVQFEWWASNKGHHYFLLNK